MIGVYLKRRFGVKFLFDMRGFWADERVDGCLWDRRNPIFNKIYLFFKRQERQFIESADHIVSLTYSGAEEIKKWDYIDKENLPLSVIPCCVDTNLFNRDNISEVDLDEKRNELGLKKDDIIISYLGSIGTWYLLDEMLQFFKVFVGVEPRAKFLFITEDSHETIKSKGRNMNINNERIITTSSERLFVPLYLALSNFSIFFIKPVYSKKSSSPTKQGELMSMGVPVICNANIGDTDWVVDKYNSGLIVSSLDKDQYRKVIDKMFRAKFISNDIRNGAVDYFSLENGVEKYAKIYASISQEII
jgi:glycosyltransferase involved in cell wall biosynthesis